MDQQGNVTKYKAWLVAQGFVQIPGVNYYEVFMPVMQIKSLHALFAIATVLDLEIDIIDIVGTYLNDTLNEEIYMKQPPMYETGDGMVCQLKWMLYGLKQSGWAWSEKLNETLIELGLKWTHVDQCVYIKWTETLLLILAIHMDNMAIFTSDWQELNQFKVTLANRFNISDTGEAKTIVSLEIKHDQKKENNPYITA